MYQPMLFIHWKQVRFALIPLTLAAFGLPLMAVQGLGTPPGMQVIPVDAFRLASGAALWAPAYPILAFAIGLILALTAWNWDHQLKHVYALSLPLSRAEYALLKMGAGMLLALLPATAFFVGAEIAAASVSLPVGLHAYPGALSLRFLLAVLLSYAVMFALAAGTVRTTLWIVTAVTVFVIVGNVGTSVLAERSDFFMRFNVVEWVFQAVARAPGPGQVFTGNWSLIDV